MHLSINIKKKILQCEKSVDMIDLCVIFISVFLC